MPHATPAPRGRQAHRLADALAQAPGLPFADLLPTESVAQALAQESVTFYDRLFSPLVTLWVFLSQVLDPDRNRTRHKACGKFGGTVTQRVSGVSPSWIPPHRC